MSVPDLRQLFKTYSVEAHTLDHEFVQVITEDIFIDLMRKLDPQPPETDNQL